MKIAVISDFNIAGQPTALASAINKYTNHQARCIIAHDDSFAYDKDIILKSNMNWIKEACEEATAWAKQCDFFHFGRGIFDWPGVEWNRNVLNKNNCCIKYYGSELRTGWQTIKKFHETTGFSAITGTDWSITGHLLGSFYHLGSYFTKYGDMDIKEIPCCSQKGNGPLKISAGSAGSPYKGYEFLNQTIQELQEEGVKVELQILSQLSNEECLKKKLESQVTFTSLHGAWGISGIESMWQGQVVMSCIDPWMMTFYPNNPTVTICKENLKDQIRKLAQMNSNDLATLGAATRDFVAFNFNTKIILKRYLYLIDLIRHIDTYMNGGRLPEIIYEF